MKAAVYTSYGSADVVHIADVDKPVPKDNEVLIKVHAASLNPLDWRFMHGQPRVFRFMPKLLKMPIGRPGVDVAGEIEAVGAKVTQLEPGDTVFGSCPASMAEYACAKETGVVRKPDNVTFEEAASINVAGVTAVQGLRDHGKIQPGYKVLINGAAGGVGTFAVQLGKILNAHVTGVCSTRNLELIRSIGADEAIDYTREDFTKGSQRYDVILDCVGNHSFSECRRVMTPAGRCMMIGAPHDASFTEIMATLVVGHLQSMFGSQKCISFIAKSSQSDLTLLGGLVADGKLKPVIDKSYRLSEAREAMRHVEEGHARGKVIVRI